MGVIDALSAGLRAVARHLWLIVLPAALDLFLWLGPRLSVRSLVEQWVRQWQSMMDVAAPEMAVPSMDLLVEMLRTDDQSINLLSLLANRLVGQPSLAPLLPGGGWGGVIEVQSLGGAILGGVVFAALGLLIAALYLSLIVGQLREPGPDWQGFGRQLLRRWLQLGLYVAALLATIVAIALPFSLAFALAMLMGPTTGPAIIGILTMVLIWLSLWLFLSLFFVTPAIVLDDANVVTAVWCSINVVVRNFWGTVGLWLLTQFILVGFSLIWQRLSQWPLGGFIGIIGNAYLATGLIAASIYFYQDRCAKWQAQRVARRQI